jgi:hypothetical protein
MAEKAKQPTVQGTRKSTSDALDKNGNVNQEKLAENQRKLGVGADHKTPEMKKRHRGSFP